MNIYINTESIVRELDGNILLALIAASKGHEVIVSDLESILKGIKAGILTPGIFHTKSLTPANHKIALHDFMIKEGFKITSLDQEPGIEVSGYDSFASARFSDKSIEQSSAVFCWGPEDFTCLKKKYPNHVNKFYLTGSPRVDLWRPRFKDYWSKPKKNLSKPFLLISSSMTRANTNDLYFEEIKKRQKFNYYENNFEQELKVDLFRASEDLKKTYHFIEAIKYLAKNNIGYDIIFRPHPAENIDTWKFYLGGIPNVYVIREGPISIWVNNSFAIMHSRCTTSIEATIAQKKVITFIPFKTEFYNDAISNQLGHKVENLNDLLQVVNYLFTNRNVSYEKNFIEKDFELINNKILLDENKLAADKINLIWNNISCNSNKTNWTKFKLFLKLIRFRKLPSIILKKLFPKIFGIYEENKKFPDFSNQDIYESINRLQKILDIKSIECNILSEKVIFFKKKSNS